MNVEIDFEIDEKRFRPEGSKLIDYLAIIL